MSESYIEVRLDYDPETPEQIESIAKNLSQKIGHTEAEVLLGYEVDTLESDSKFTTRVDRYSISETMYLDTSELPNSEHTEILERFQEDDLVEVGEIYHEAPVTQEESQLVESAVPEEMTEEQVEAFCR